MKFYEVKIWYIQDCDDMKKPSLVKYAKNAIELQHIIQHFEGDNYKIVVKTKFM